MALTSKRAAFFDVDNTLVRGSTLYFLGRGMYQRGFFTKADISRFVVANLRFRMTGTEKKEVIEKFQNAATDFIGGHRVEEIKKIGEEIYDEYVSPKLWQGTFEIAKSHLDKGEEVWLVTAAPQDMANIIASRLGLTGALGSKATIQDGIYTGSLEGKLLHGNEKAIAIRELAQSHGFNLDDCYSYSDSQSCGFVRLPKVGQSMTSVEQDSSIAYLVPLSVEL
jgi:HAD superfamily hydrolase (TIGR01490 family)